MLIYAQFKITEVFLFVQNKEDNLMEYTFSGPTFNDKNECLNLVEFV